MSARTPRLVFAPDARIDLRDVLLYTQQRWGRRQRAVYRQTCYRAFDDLRRFPGLGRPRPEYGADIRSMPVGQHVIILHANRDIDAELVE